MLLHHPQRQLHNPRLHNLHRHSLTLRHGVEAGHVLAAVDDEAAVVDVEAAVAQEDLLLRLQRRAVRREDQDLVVLVEGHRDHGALDHGGHEDGLRGNLARLDLKSHHEATISRDGTSAPHLQELNAFGKVPLNFLRKLAPLGHLEGHAWDYSVENVVVEACLRVGVSSCRWVVIVKADYAQPWVLFLRRSSLSLCLHRQDVLVGLHELSVRVQQLRVARLLPIHCLEQLLVDAQQLLVLLGACTARWPCAAGPDVGERQGRHPVAAWYLLWQERLLRRNGHCPMVHERMLRRGCHCRVLARTHRRVHGVEVGVLRRARRPEPRDLVLERIQPVVDVQLRRLLLLLLLHGGPGGGRAPRCRSALHQNLSSDVAEVTAVLILHGR
mmetsp:Transcript_84254/g.247145  ORF Transcript_84254/g.247145 Transcript_84254/m.247145 type:complete len:384 (+) Transcript_84254:1165-2316(+)